VILERAGLSAVAVFRVPSAWSCQPRSSIRLQIYCLFIRNPDGLPLKLIRERDDKFMFGKPPLRQTRC